MGEFPCTKEVPEGGPLLIFEMLRSVCKIIDGKREK